MNEPDFSTGLEPHRALFLEWGFTEDQIARLVAYLGRLWAANQSMNLFSRKLSPQSLMVDHLLDCLIALPFFPNTQSAADLGSGGGFPGIPLAIARPGCQFNLFEKSPKKRQFLASISDLAPNTTVYGLIGPDSIPTETGWVTARAFKPIPVILELTRNYAKAGGRYLLYKGRHQVIESELKAAKCRPNQVTRHRLNPIGTAEERYLVEIKSR